MSEEQIPQEQMQRIVAAADLAYDAARWAVGRPRSGMQAPRPRSLASPALADPATRVPRPTLRGATAPIWRASCINWPTTASSRGWSTGAGRPAMPDDIDRAQAREEEMRGDALAEHQRRAHGDPAVPSARRCTICGEDIHELRI